jgi:hypothetical protein
VFRGPKLPKTCSKLIVGATTVVKRDITPTDAPIRALMLISPLQLHLPLPVEPTLFMLLPSRTTPVGESIMWVWKKHNVLIDCTKKSVKLTTLEGEEMEFITESVVTAKGVANRSKVNQLKAS